jgi:hypothetical protein
MGNNGGTGMNCQRCNSDRLVSIHGKTSDMFDMSAGEETRSGYVPTNLFFGRDGYGDYMEATFCAECGQIQAKFPISESAITKAMNGLEE